MYLLLLSVPNLPFINEDGLPKSLLLKSFDLQIVMARCDIDSIGLILRRMPNLHHFRFTLIINRRIPQFMMGLADGQNWHDMLTNHVPYLKKFDFHISFLKLMSEPMISIILLTHSSVLSIYIINGICALVDGDTTKIFHSFDVSQISRNREIINKYFFRLLFLRRLV